MAADGTGLMEPAHMHISLDEESMALKLPTMTVGQGGAHGAGVTGMHGAGVWTPSAAAVRAMTIGFVTLLHMPKGTMFAIGMLSMIVATNFPSIMTGGPLGITISFPGARPIVQVNVSPMSIGSAMQRF